MSSKISLQQNLFTNKTNINCNSDIDIQCRGLLGSLKTVTVRLILSKTTYFSSAHISTYSLVVGNNISLSTPGY